MGEVYPRDMIGYGASPPAADWPGGARLAVQIVLNYEEGAERCILHGDAASEVFLSETPGGVPRCGVRDMNVESVYEYGSRAGFWRCHRELTGRGVPVTIFGVTEALGRHPEAVAAMRAADWEIACHGLRWLDCAEMSEERERAAIVEALTRHGEICGAPPCGWYTGRVSPNTASLVDELAPDDLYLADSYADDLPYWRRGLRGGRLIVPYTLDCNDMRFAIMAGFDHGEAFFSYLRDAFDTLYAEGAVAPKMMSIGLHNRLVGRPGRFASFRRFLDHVQGHEGVWLCRRVDVARHWKRRHPYDPSCAFDLRGA